ncbi:F0F1 ATP synthase subunit B [Jiangella anatolica]|uniref:ATP synthase subunit b n=1 Tax=Jiangella anatolica TaxID=2670374 RepID=A0A2W2CC68_9ACTN|nr:F0F1 ATP synthase subunit B [Jiangella anatolica]PZF85809.1 F0F1 ATP synthase subunit B [Jiangella anatolica]
MAPIAVIAAEDGPDPLLPHTSELIVGLVAFALLFFFLRAKVYPIFERTYAERAAAIQGGAEKAEQAQAEANQLLEEYRAQLADARSEAARIREDAKQQGAAIVAQAREEAEAEAKRVAARAEAQLQAEREQVLRELRGEVGSLATTLAGKVVGESLQDDDRSRRVVERFLADLETAQASDAAGPRDA